MAKSFKEMLVESGQELEFQVEKLRTIWLTEKLSGSLIPE